MRSRSSGLSRVPRSGPWRTRCTASEMWTDVIWPPWPPRMVIRAASLMTLARSAPVNPGVSLGQRFEVDVGSHRLVPQSVILSACPALGTGAPAPANAETQASPPPPSAGGLVDGLLPPLPVLLRATLVAPAQPPPRRCSPCGRRDEAPRVSALTSSGILAGVNAERGKTMRSGRETGQRACRRLRATVLLFAVCAGAVLLGASPAIAQAGYTGVPPVDTSVDPVGTYVEPISTYVGQGTSPGTTVRLPQPTSNVRSGALVTVADKGLRAASPVDTGDSGNLVTGRDLVVMAGVGLSIVAGAAVSTGRFRSR